VVGGASLLVRLLCVSHIGGWVSAVFAFRTL
jgi:hypothetical protein